MPIGNQTIYRPSFGDRSLEALLQRILIEMINLGRNMAHPGRRCQLLGNPFRRRHRPAAHHQSRPGAGESGDEVLIADVAAVDPQVVLTMADITAVGPTGILAPATIRFVLTHPAQPSLLFIMALDALGREVYVFSYDLATEELALRLQSPIRPFHVLGFSPDGRWLVLTGSNNDDSNPAGSPGSLYVQEIATQETQTYVLQFASFILSPIFDWSADSQWLLFTVDDRLISLVAPDYAYQWVVAHGRENCTATYWTN